jgi:hypothetical protein
VVISQMHQEDQLQCEVEIRHRVEVVRLVVEGLELSDTQHRGMLGLNHISLFGGVDKNINSRARLHLHVYYFDGQCACL